MQVKIKGVNPVRRKLADGTVKTYYYDRATGIRLKGEPDSIEFAASLDEARKSQAQHRNPNTISWLIKEYCGSRAWLKLAASTREIGAYNLKAVEDKWGDTPLKIAGDKRSRPVFMKWHDKLAQTHPRAADAKMAALARVLEWGHVNGYLDGNPIVKFERAYSSNRAEMIWLPEHIQAFEQVAAPELVLAMMLGLHTGQRQGDLLRLPWSAYDGEAISLRQSKGGRPVYVPCTQALKATLDGQPRRSTQILTRANGTPWTRDAFKKAWAAAYEASGLLDDLHFHDLRGTAVTMLAEAGCTVPEIATITGHTQDHAQKILDRYLARTRALAESAIAKLDEHRRNKG
jgi:integrase